MLIVKSDKYHVWASFQVVYWVRTGGVSRKNVWTLSGGGRLTASGVTLLAPVLGNPSILGNPGSCLMAENARQSLVKGGGGSNELHLNCLLLMALFDIDKGFDDEDSCCEP